jgi:hypothetical protein
MKLSLDKGLVSTRLTIFRTIQLALGEAAGPFLMIEPLMRHIAEMHPSMQAQVTLSIQAKKNSNNKRYANYWDCDSKHLVKAIESEFGSVISKEELQHIKDYPDRRDKFLHGVYPALMTLMQVEPTSRLQTGGNRFVPLQQGEIYESLLSMERNGVFSSLRIYSNSVTEALEKIANSLAI